MQPIARAHIEGRSLTADEFRALEDCARSPYHDRWRERIVAAWLLSRAATSDAERLGGTVALVAALHQGFGLRARRAPIPIAPLWWAFVLLPAFALCYAGVVLDYVGGDSSAFFTAGKALIAACAIGAPAVWIVRSASRAAHRDRVAVAAIAALGRLGRAEAVPVLAGIAAGAGDAAAAPRTRDVRALAAASLRACTLALTRRHFGALTGDAVPNLCALVSSPDEATALAALDALDCVGTGKAVAPVRRAAQRGATPAVRARAAAVLPTLEERDRQARQPHTLVRPAEGPGPHVTLVRPAGAGADGRTQRLLRPHESQ